MHTEVNQFVSGVKNKYFQYFTKVKVLEVGSLNINGSVRDFFTSCNYLGIDIGEGNGVDLVCPIHKLNKHEEFDVVISSEMLEHDIHWKESLSEMYKSLVSGGILIFTCASTNRAEHGTKRTSPQDAPFCGDYYKNISIDDFESILSKSLFSSSYIEINRNGEDLYFYGIKI